MRCELRAIPEAPLHLSNRHAVGNYAGTLDYISGTALRGALAAAYLERPDLQHGVANRLDGLGLTFQDYFSWLFLSGRVRFPNLYPMGQRRPFVLPLSARSCKRFPGFQDEDVPFHERPHGVYDVLLHEPDEFCCPARLGDSTCLAPMEKVVGFYDSSDGRVEGARRASGSRRVLTRTAIEYETEAVRHGALYSLETLEEGGGGFTIFIGDLMIRPPARIAQAQADIARHVFLEDLSGALSKVFVGGAKTRGLGAVKLEVSEGDPLPILPPLEERFDRLQDVWQQVNPTRRNQMVFTLTLNSDAILLDELWRYRSVLDEKTLCRERADAVPYCLEKRCFTDTRIVSGWNSAHRLPKEDELAILKGAAFLYTTSADRATLLQWLQELEDDGIGERRNEGFGQVIACHSFHREVP